MNAAEQPIDQQDDAPLVHTSAIRDGAYGEIMRRAKDRPLSFTFVWRGADFKGLVECGAEGMRLSLQSDLGAIPFSAENSTRRSGMIAVADTFAAGEGVNIRVVQGRSIMFEHDMVLQVAVADTISSIVTQLTTLVLATAPYLDLIAEVTLSSAEDRPTYFLGTVAG